MPLLNENRRDVVCPDQPIDYQTALQISLQIGCQILALAERNLCIPIVTPSLILQNKNGEFILNPSSYVELAIDKTYKISSKDDIYEDKTYLPPEMLKKISDNYSYTTSLYSLAVSVLKLLDMNLENLEPTKLFYLLKRCLRKNPKDRLFLYV